MKEEEKKGMERRKGGLALRGRDAHERPQEEGRRREEEHTHRTARERGSYSQGHPHCSEKKVKRERKKGNEGEERESQISTHRIREGRRTKRETSKMYICRRDEVKK